MNLRFRIDSNKTKIEGNEFHVMFQNCVILDSNKTDASNLILDEMFQNCVILDSNKTSTRNYKSARRVLELCYFRQ